MATKITLLLGMSVSVEDRDVSSPDTKILARHCAACGEKLCQYLPGIATQQSLDDRLVQHVEKSPDCIKLGILPHNLIGESCISTEES